MRRFLFNFMIALGIAAGLLSLIATIALPFVVFATWLDNPWSAVAAFAYGVVWFCFVMALVVTVDGS